MTSYYECHITMEGDPMVAKAFIEKIKWKFSAIDGDIVIGAGTKLYATKQFNERLSRSKVKGELMRVARRLEQKGMLVLRRKVELVIFDDRSSKVDACNGECVECYLEDIAV